MYSCSFVISLLLVNSISIFCAYRTPEFGLVTSQVLSGYIWWVATISDSVASDATISSAMPGPPASESPRIWIRAYVLAKSPGNLCALCKFDEHCLWM